MEWRPIEEAPKDGTQILLCYGLTHVVVGWFDDDEIKFKWQILDWDNELNATPDNAQVHHWMPLPPPPEQER